MVIAWTALFHAIFFKRKVNPFYRKPGSKRYLVIDGDYKHWELKMCLENFYLMDTNNPVRKNLEFFIKLRNKIEHRSFPEIDANIFGECQSLLFNFDQLIEKEFSLKYCIRESLSFSLQLFPSSETLSSSFNLKAKTKEVISFIENYRTTISTETLESGRYSFKAFLIQVANHPSSDALPIQFIQYDKLSDEDKTKMRRIAAMVKYKPVEGSEINVNLLKPAEVVKKVQSGLGDKKIEKNGKKIDLFNMNTHSRCWKKYQVRPGKGSKPANKTKKEFCIYDKAHEDYLYREEWVQYLIKELSKENEILPSPPREDLVLE